MLIGPLSVTGLTAYFGLLEVGQPKPGDTVLVSAAAGAVGTMVGQIAKLAGCRVVGTAGGQDKCDWLVRELGFDAAVDYKAGGVRRALAAACPDGIDVYFDNTGGPVLDAALSLMNLRGRIVCCGNVSQYDVEKPAPGPMAVPGLVVTKRLRMEGFIVMDFYDRRAEAEARLARWVAEGRIKAVVDIVDGLDKAPEALIGLFAGKNRGKMASSAFDRLSPDEHRLPLLHERPHRLLVILGARGLHQPLGLAVERGRIVDVQRVVEIVLHVAQRHPRTLGQRLGEGEGLVLQFVVGHDPVHQPDALAALGVDPLGGEHQLARARRAHGARQQPGDAVVAAEGRRAHSRC